MGFLKDIGKAAKGAVDSGSGFLGDVGDKAGALASTAGSGALSAIQSDEAASISSGVGGFLTDNSPSALIGAGSEGLSGIIGSTGIGGALGGLGEGLAGIGGGLGNIGGGLGGMLKNPMTMIILAVVAVVILMVMK